ncbi:MAG: single-stranded-DNA-specific exonuclease RecJ [Gemmatimonadales bacterium]|nr:single-stranded-DNA-specific exonuclease RecJ [Gemmatimonadales bacterium]
MTPANPRLVLRPAPDAAATAALAEALGIPRPLAALLVQRGHDAPDAARRFLRPELDQLGDPLALRGMADAVEVIARAVRSRRPILVHGDYDVDGQCATAILVRALRVAGADVTPFVPHRMRDGYDFGPAGLRAAEAAGAGLVITCDCGITAVEAVAAARAAGRDVVVTDHHLPGAVLPAANAVVDPQQPGDTSGLSQLCGSGIAFKLVQALVPVLDLPRHLPLHLLDYAALATVADVVPLTGENRVIVRHGLRLLAQSRWPGLRALLAASQLDPASLRASHLGYVLGPRLNAAGRVGDAMDGVTLLLEDDAHAALALAARLEAMNRERQALDQRMLDDAIAEVEAYGTLPPAVVLGRDGWHAGVVGIVASRLVERFGRPAFLVAFEAATGVGKGSGRSISAFDLHAALHGCGDLLERFGGHHAAAGLTVRRERFDAFRERFTALAAEALDPGDLGPEQRIDLEIGLADASPELERLVRHLEPCGMGNPAPVFGVRGVRLADRRAVGGGDHLKGVLDDGARRLDAIAFQWGARAAALGQGPLDCAFRLEENRYRGATALQARVLALAPA